MSIFSLMGLSCGDGHHHDLDKKESEVALIDETRESTGVGSFDMDIHQHDHLYYPHHHTVEEVDFDTDFWPVEHPLEPQDEDRPVKCPIPTSSLINDGRVMEERYGESLRKRAELPTIMDKEATVNVATERTPFQRVRKRHHSLAHGGDHIMTPLTRMSAHPPSPSQNVTIFHMLQQLDEFEC